MVDGNSFVKAGWVHQLKAHLFKHEAETHWLIMGTVVRIILYTMQ